MGVAVSAFSEQAGFRPHRMLLGVQRIIGNHRGCHVAADITRLSECCGGAEKTESKNRKRNKDLLHRSVLVPYILRASWHWVNELVKCRVGRGIPRGRWGNRHTKPTRLQFNLDKSRALG